MRNTFANEIKNIGDKNEKVILLSGDIGNKMFDSFKDNFPARFYNCGIAEQNMISVASGLALSGFRPVVYTITPFIIFRAFEQIKIDLCYHNLPVVLIGTGSGLSYSELGATHHSCEDIGVLRTLPNMTIICPANPYEVKHALNAALNHTGPIYIRLGKKGEPVLHKNSPKFEIGKAITLKEGKDICILATGNIVSSSLQVSEELERSNISAKVVSFHTVKPLDEELLDEAFKKFDLVVTIEEHTLIGGFGSSVAEWMSDKGIVDKRLLRIGLKDEFLHKIGDQEYSRKLHELDNESITKKILSSFNKRK